MASFGLVDSVVRPLVRPVTRGRASLAFAGLVLFVFLVYSNPGNLFFPDAADANLAKPVAGLALVALAAAWLLQDRRIHLGGAIGALLCAYFATIGLSATWSLWPSMSFDMFTDGLKYFAIFFVAANVLDDAKRGSKFVHALAWASVIPALGCINSYFHGEHLVDGDRAGWIGIFANPNDLAYHLAVGIALSLGGRELARKSWLRTAYLGGMAIMVGAILLTQSRGGLIATGTVIGLYSIRGLKRGRALVGVGALLALAVYFGPAATWQRGETIADYKDDASAQGRIDAWRTGLNVFEGRPLTGVGAGAFTLAWAEFAPGDAGPARSAHNTFVQVVAETGLPSFLLFVGAVAAAALGLSRAARPKPGDDENPGRHDLATLARTTQVALGGFVVSSLTGGLAYTWPLYLLLGMAAAFIRIERFGAATETSPAPRPVFEPLRALPSPSPETR